MKLRLWHAPVRLATGAFILNSGLAKLRVKSEERDKAIHGMAANAYPAFESLDPGLFTRILGASEVALGAALLTPMVSPGLAGAALTAFSGGLLGLYMRTPGMREADGIRPSQDGMALAKDVWMASIGAALMLDAAGQRVRGVGRALPKALPGR